MEKQIDKCAPLGKSITKCGNCGGPIVAVDIIVMFHNGDRIHVRCWRVGEMEQRLNDGIPVRRTKVDRPRVRATELQTASS
jgi:hypothetical protein